MSGSWQSSAVLSSKSLYNLPLQPPTHLFTLKGSGSVISSSGVLGKVGKRSWFTFLHSAQISPSMKQAELLSFQVSDLLGQFLHVSEPQKHRSLWAKRNLFALCDDQVPLISEPQDTSPSFLSLCFYLHQRHKRNLKCFCFVFMTGRRAGSVRCRIFPVCSKHY